MESVYGIIYKLTNTINKKVYIGYTTHPFNVRLTQHIYEARHNSHYPIHQAIRKYGINNFITEIIDTASNLQELKEKEIYWINQYQSYSKGYNATIGGDGNNRQPVRYYLVNILDATIIKTFNSATEMRNAGYNITDHDKKTTIQYIPYMAIQADRFDQLTPTEQKNYIYNLRPRIICQLDKNYNLIQRWLNVGDILKQHPDYTKSCLHACLQGKRQTHRQFRWMYYEDWRRFLSDLQA